MQQERNLLVSLIELLIREGKEEFVKSRLDIFFTNADNRADFVKYFNANSIYHIEA